MNVLLLVVVLIMSLSMLTYAKMQSFLDQRLLNNQYLCTITVEKNNYANQVAIDQYENTHGEGTGQVSGFEKAEGTQYLDIKPLFNPKFNEGSLQKIDAITTIFKRLIVQLYKEQPFFIRELNENPAILDELLDQLRQRFLQLQPNFKLQKLNDLAKIELNNERMQTFLAKILKGSGLVECSNDDIKPGTPPLNQYVRVTYLDPKIQVGTTSPAILLAIFGDPALVERIMQKRNELHRIVKAASEQKGDDVKAIKEVASNDFRALFQNELPDSFPIELFNFKITSTSPTNR